MAAGRVICSGEHGHARSATFEPVMATAVDLNEYAFVGMTFPTQAVRSAPALSSGTGDAGFDQDTAHGRA